MQNMNIHFFPDALYSPELIEFIEGLVKYACETMQFDASETTSIAIAEPDQYKEAVSYFDIGETASNNDYYVGVGKSYSRSINGVNNHYLIYNINVILGIVSALGNKNRPMSHEENICYNVFFHEFGHLVDNQARKLFTATKTLDPQKFCIDSVAAYYTELLIGEFFASYHSAFAFAAVLFSEQNNDDNSTFEKALDNIINLKTRYVEDKNVLFKLAYDVSQLSWVILTQYSKLIGVNLGNKNRVSIEIQLFQSASPNMTRILKKLNEILIDCRNNYPKIPKDAIPSLIELWHKTSLSIGFKFTKSSNGDSVYFDLPDQ